MSEKTHKPTPKKLRDIRKRGEVVRSRELASLGAYVAVWGFLWLGTGYLGPHLFRIIERAIEAASATGRADPASPAGASGVDQWLLQWQGMEHDLFWILGPLLGLSVACAVLVSAIQSRGVFSFVPITPNFARINPGQGLQNLFSVRNLFELGKLLLKTSLLLGVLGYTVVSSLDLLVKMVYAPAGDLLRDTGTIVWRVLGWAAVIYALAAALDYAHQYYEFMKRNRMSIEELRRDHRETEGDPRIKVRRRTLAQELAFSTLINRVSSANVLVVNPTHVSVALYYVSGQTALPRVIAKGLDALALRMRAQAEREGIPVLENAPLARQLFREVAVDQYINDGLIDAVAAAFRWAKQVDRRAAQSGSRSPKQNPTPRTV